MKTKNLMLGVLALIIAVGSAFASIASSANNGYIKVLLTDQTTQRCDAVAQCDLVVGTTCTANFSGMFLSNPGSHSIRPQNCPASTLNHSTGSVGNITVANDVYQIL